LAIEKLLNNTASCRDQIKELIIKTKEVTITEILHVLKNKNGKFIFSIAKLIFHSVWLFKKET
jgi:hypothetical protein